MRDEDDKLINAKLWNPRIKHSSDRMTALMEQYKLCVEMADRISARRAHANTFFLTLNTGGIGALGLCIKNLDWLMSVPVCLAAVALCYCWLRLIKSYRRLNTVKYKVLETMEEKLPPLPWTTEWACLGQGKDPRKYTGLTGVEKRVPAVFALLYVTLLLGSPGVRWVRDRLIPPSDADQDAKISLPVADAGRVTAEAQTITQEYMAELFATRLQLRIARDRLAELGEPLDVEIERTADGEYRIYRSTASGEVTTRPVD